MMSETRVVGGHYRLLGLLGEGGMSVVYDGEDLNTNTPVAIKLLKPEIVGSNPSVVERFIREGEVLRRLNHPNIVKMLDAFEQDGKNYVVMERVSGGDLAQLLRERGPLSIERVLDIALDLTDALIRAHRINVIHRDIKPANVLLAEDGTPRLTDFGVARLGDATSVTKSGTLVGTIAYLSPEGCLGEPLDARADIWSFGVMLYEMLTGYRPFMDANTAALLTAILTRPVPPLGKLRAGRTAEAAIDIGTAAQLAPETWAGADIVYGQSALLIANNPAGAIPFFDAALTKKPDDWLSLTFRGAAHYMTGNYAQADADISRAITLDPRFNAPYSFAALNAFREGRLSEAIRLTRIVQERFPDPATGERLTSGVYNIPKDQSPLVGLISAYGNFTLFQWDAVIRDAELVTAQTDRLPGVLLLKGIAECNLGRYADAEASYTRVLEADREFPAVYLLRADVHRKQGDLQGMAADVAAVAASPQAAIYAQIAPALLSGEITCENLFEINLADYGLSQ